MSTQEEKLKAIADAIREKDGTAEPIPANDFPERIRAIEVGGKLPEDIQTIVLTANPPEGGTVRGGGVASDGMTLSVNAEAAEGYSFNIWQDNGKTVSEEPKYTFTVTEDVELVAVFSVSKPSRLPEGYTEVEYIQSSGTQYIDTNISDFPGLNVDCVIEFTEDNSQNMSVFVSSRRNSSTYLFFGFNVSADNQLNCLYATNRHVFGAIARNQKYHCKVRTNGREFSVNDDKFLTSTAFTTSYNSMFIFATHNAYSNSATEFSKMRLYGFDITRDADGGYIRQYIPCINPSGIVGLYDLAENKFYNNLGTGTFIAGPAV